MKCSFIGYFKPAVILLSALLLFSCSSEPVKEIPDKASEKKNIIVIDAAVKEQFNTALAALKSENYDEAIRILENVIALEKRVPAPYINLAMAYEKKNRLKKTERYLLDAVKIDLSHPVANNQLGLLYRKQGKFADARKAYTNALINHPDYLPVIKNLGILCELYLRDLACASQQYEHYQSLQPDDKTMKIWISDLNQRMR
ncbi:hypothetical protein MNBD_GAMMA11-686 [hydrothermal vent metagenome]|uniref:Uncharacterized protein n=1 Tax=hydrothermal vent metagenome TaxID=652676 RepID=A0A3B0XFU4_9ZZZZ